MKILEHRLYHDDDKPVSYTPTPNISGSMTPQFLIMHYTAGRDAESSIRVLTNPNYKASAHLVIGRDGQVTQLAPFDTIAWHAGRSYWQGLNGMNKYSIGIELDNMGKLDRSGDGWHAWFGEQVDSAQVIERPHKNSPDISYGWQLYTPEQLLMALEISSVIIRHYNLIDIIGHDDVAPRRKLDPGPAFPMENFRSRLFGRADVAESELTYRTTTNLNIRIGPGAYYDTLPVTPLPKGVRVEILDSDGVWKYVNVLDEIKGTLDVEGWVHGRYLEPIA